MKRFSLLLVLLSLSFTLAQLKYPPPVQNILPRAGEVSTKNITKADIFDIINNQQSPINKSTLELLNFDSLNVSFKGNYPFAISYGFATSDSGDLAFVGSGGGIYVTDITNPSNPTILSEIRTRSLVDACTYDPVKKLLYVCAYFSGIEIWDLTDVHNPVRASRIPTDPYPRSGVTYVGDYIFITTNTQMWSIDVSNPGSPIIGNKADLGLSSTAFIFQIARQGNIIYVVSDQQGLILVDISNPKSLRVISSSPYIPANRFAVSGNHIYAVEANTGQGTFTVLDITDTLNVTFAGSLNLGGYPENLLIIDNKAYVAKANGGSGGGIDVVDISNPASPSLLHSYAGDYQFISGNKDYLYLTRNSDFSVLDIRDSVRYVSGFEIPGYIQSVASNGKYIYTGSNGFRVLSLADTSEPVQIGYADTTGDFVKIVDSSLVIYCPISMTAHNDVHFMNVSDPTHPVSLFDYHSPVMTMNVAVKDKLAFVACWWDGVRVLDFTDPSNVIFKKRIMGWFTNAIPGTDFSYVQAVAVEGNYLYIIDWGPFVPNEDTPGLYIIDVSDISNPVLVKRYQGITGHPVDIKVVDGLAYIADGSGGMEIVDVSDPNNPALLSDLRLPDGATGIDVDGNFAYTSNYIRGGVQVIDIFNPGVPEVLGYYKPTGCFAIGISVNNGTIYAADGLAGFQMYRNLLAPVVSVKEEIVNQLDYKLSANYPNPFNPKTNIEYQVPNRGFVTLKIYDLLGREVATLVNEEKQAGSYKIDFNAAKLASGIYFYQLKAGDFVQTKKMTLLK